MRVRVGVGVGVGVRVRVRVRVAEHVPLKRDALVHLARVALGLLGQLLAQPLLVL